MTEGKKKGKGMEMKMKEDTYVKMSASSIFHHCCGHSVEENFYKSHSAEKSRIDNLEGHIMKSSGERYLK